MDEKRFILQVVVVIFAVCGAFYEVFQSIHQIELKLNDKVSTEYFWRDMMLVKNGLDDTTHRLDKMQSQVDTNSGAIEQIAKNVKTLDTHAIDK